MQQELRKQLFFNGNLQMTIASQENYITGVA